jgi:hypothetical protein
MKTEKVQISGVSIQTQPELAERLFCQYPNRITLLQILPKAGTITIEGDVDAGEVKADFPLHTVCSFATAPPVVHDLAAGEANI